MKIKRILAAVLSLAMGVSMMTACGSSDSSSKAENDSSATENTQKHTNDPGETGRSTGKLSLVIRPMQIITVSGSGRATIQAIIIQMEAGRSGIVIPGQHFGHRWEKIKEQLSM